MAWGLTLFGVLAVAKLAAVQGRELPLSPWTPLALFGPDAMVALAFAFLALPLGRGRALPYALLCLLAAVDAGVARVVGTPLTWPMLQATGPALSDSVADSLRPEVLWAPALVLTAGLLLPRLANRLPLAARGWGLVMLGLLALAGSLARGRQPLPPAAQNGLWALLASASPRLPAGEVGTADWRQWRPGGEESSALHGAAAGRNVVLVVLESAVARALGAYGARPDPMPNLTRLARQGMLCTDAYTVYPESIRGMVALLHSVHPAPEVPVEVYRRLPVPSLAEVLGAQGYRTALFHSGRFHYLGMEDVLAAAGFGETHDAGDLGGRRESSFGIDEESTVAGALSWIDERDGSAPFLLAWLPVAGHHPYDSPGDGPFAYDTVEGCYRNALHYADRALGMLVDGLRQRGLWEDTLLCVVGDHGQAFGEHDGNYGHTFYLFEENVRVPLLFVAPGILDGQTERRVVSQVDVVPTLLDLLGVPEPAGIEGHSLLRGGTGLALLFTDYASLWLGLRDGPWKFLHEVDSGRDLLFDLAADPGEQHDLSETAPERVAFYRRHLLRWASSRRAAAAGW